MPTIHDAIQATFRNRDEPVRNASLFRKAWHEFDELQCQSEETWVGTIILSLQGMDRYEIAIYNTEGEAVGAIVLADDYDVHVGPCISVFAQYVHPDYRHKNISPRLMRESLRIAKNSGAPVLAWTHRIGPWKYQTLYRRIR